MNPDFESNYDPLDVKDVLSGKALATFYSDACDSLRRFETAQLLPYATSTIAGQSLWPASCKLNPEMDSFRIHYFLEVLGGVNDYRAEFYDMAQLKFACFLRHHLHKNPALLVSIPRSITNACRFRQVVVPLSWPSNMTTMQAIHSLAQFYLETADE